MKNIKRILILGIITLLIIGTNTTYARLVDIEYPPNSTGYTDFTSEEADQQAAEQANELSNTSTSEDYAEKSSNNNLSSLEIENATIEPEFNSWTVDYTITLDDQDTKTITINAQAEDEMATVEGAGTIELTDGINNLQIVVTAENGNVKIYNLTINLPYVQSDLRLKSLEISGIHVDGGKDSKEKLSPTFDKDVFEYTLTVPYSINGLNINAEAEDGAYVSLTGQDSLQVGTNTVLIEVIDTNDENIKTTYVIEVERKEESKAFVFIVATVIIVAILIILGFIILKTKKKKRKRKHG